LGGGAARMWWRVRQLELWLKPWLVLLLRPLLEP